MRHDAAISRNSGAPGKDRRGRHPDGDRSLGTCIEQTGSESWIPRFSIYAETAEQLQAAASYISGNQFVPERIYLGTDVQAALMKENGDGQVSRALCMIRESEAGIAAAMPHILRSTEAPTVDRLLNAADKLSPDGILIRSYEEFQLLRERGFDKRIILDHNLYVFNRYAKKFWNDLGISDFTAPLELNASELFRLRLNDCELGAFSKHPGSAGNSRTSQALQTAVQAAFLYGHTVISATM